ncbi:MAG: protein kinase [Verrucomicrobia bacterium]|nr:protein kinase [Verrucomicrobiota bacterium]
MSLVEKDFLRCEQCGAPVDHLTIAYGCFNCLLLGGPDETAFEENRRFQHYEVSVSADGTILWELGRGAMGITYHAIDINLGSPVALKVISARHSSDAGARERFRREARAAAQLRHPNVATVFHFGETPAGQCFYAMELVEGETLEARIRRDGALPVFAVLNVAEQVARALAAAERHGVVHRDLKPSNIMVVVNDAETADGMTVKVIDFGLAKAVAGTEDTSNQARVTFSGTPGFASPEQLVAGGETAAPDVRSDIYSLGATMWYLLCGTTPFAGRTLKELREQQFRQLPIQQLAAAKVPAPLVRLLRSMLATDPRDRPQSARELLDQLQRCRQMIEAKPRRRRLLQIAALAFSIIGIFSLTSYLWFRQQIPMRTSLPSVPAPEKSVAVLPFENLSNNREDAFFADGLQDDVLTKLAKIADLKVISRTSVMEYRGKRNVHQIGNALHVSHVLEGSVRKTGPRLHINAQLIDARTDTHVWAEQYDRDLKDAFVIQSEIAQKVAEKLQAKISVAEKLAIERPPTSDLTAFDLYARAKDLLLMTSFSSDAKTKLLQAADLLNQVVTLDPSFFQAYCQLAYSHDQLYFLGHDHSAARLALAEAAIRAAFRLRPEAGEAHLSRAENLYRGYLDYNGALAELEVARHTLPNDPQLFELKGYIQRRQGRWEESTRNLERAVDLDPRNLSTLQQIAISYEVLRRYAEAESVLDRVLKIKPDDLDTKKERASVEFEWKANTEPMHRLIDSIRIRDPAALPSIADSWLTCALAERDAAAAKDALVALGEAPFNDDVVQLNRLFVQGVIARMINDDVQAQVAFTAARVQQEKTVQAQPEYGPALCVLGLIDAALGRKEEALREGRRAVELLSVEKDAINGPHMIEYFAMIAAWIGDKDLACEQLATAVRRPSDFGYGELKRLPFWDSLHGDRRFEKIVDSLSPQ